MADPNWFPSAVMQTVGALYGIFIAFFVLVLQSLDKYAIKGSYHESAELFDKKIDSITALFKLLTVIVVATELYNGALVYFVSDAIYGYYKYLLFISFSTFALTVIYVAGLSYYLTSFLSSLVKKSPDFNKYNVPIFENMEEHQFLSILSNLGVISLLSVTVVYLHEKHGYGFLTNAFVLILALAVFIGIQIKYNTK